VKLFSLSCLPRVSFFFDVYYFYLLFFLALDRHHRSGEPLFLESVHDAGICFCLMMFQLRFFFSPFSSAYFFPLRTPFFFVKPHKRSFGVQGRYRRLS